ncbi:MAG: ParB/RepB/Spo0J family partition protein [Faecousia sp.]
MNERNNQARGASEWEDTYGSLGMTPRAQLIQLPLHILDPWKSADGFPQPFKAYSPEKLEELAENIRKNGVIEAICVRPKPDGRMEIIAGHNRAAAAKLAGLNTVPAIVQQLDDNQAAILLVDSNLQHREKLLPSEKAYAYKLRLDSMKRQGQRTDLTSRQNVGKSETNESTSDPNGRKLEASDPTSRQNVGKLEAADELGAEKGESGRQIQRYIRLTNLIPPLLDRVDREEIGLIAGVDLSFLTKITQVNLDKALTLLGKKKLSGKETAAIREAGDGGKDLIVSELLSILNPKKEKKAELKTKVDLSAYDQETAKRLRKDPQYLAGLQAVILSYTEKYVNQSDFGVT